MTSQQQGWRDIASESVRAMPSARAFVLRTAPKVAAVPASIAIAGEVPCA